MHRSQLAQGRFPYINDRALDSRCIEVPCKLVVSCIVLILQLRFLEFHGFAMLLWAFMEGKDARISFFFTRFAELMDRLCDHFSRRDLLRQAEFYLRGLLS